MVRGKEGVVSLTASVPLERRATPWATIVSSISGLIIISLKVIPKAEGLALKLFKSIKPGAAIVTLGVHSLISWKFAVAIMLLIGFHECGHVVAM